MSDHQVSQAWQCFYLGARPLCGLCNCSNQWRWRPLCCRYGLLQSIQHARWHFDVDINTFFPRAMNLSDAAELKAFEVDFKWSAAAAILRRVLHDGGTSSTGVPSQQHVHLAMQICSQQVWSLPSAP